MDSNNEFVTQLSAIKEMMTLNVEMVKNRIQQKAWLFVQKWFEDHPEDYAMYALHISGFGSALNKAKVDDMANRIMTALVGELAPKAPPVPPANQVLPPQPIEKKVGRPKKVPAPM